MTEDWIGRFPALAKLEPDCRRSLQAASRVVSLSAGQTVFRGGDECSNYLLVLEGSVRVQMTAESGREIVLYRVDAGETCVLTTACLLSHEAYSAEGVTETPVRAVTIPAQLFHDLLGRSAVLRAFVFTTYGARIADLMLLVEEVAFQRVDLRLARFLIERADTAGRLEATHQALAVELGTAREVVSRQLKEFERKGMVALSRGCISLRDRQALRALGAEA
ncbi:MAG: Crp/Fnr family transcriptional regulator [Rhodospirillales bacterium]|nr:MAG: Crp/Fnr family transcriptional regulator [Rhodospirillales bacterium]